MSDPGLTSSTPGKKKRRITPVSLSQHSDTAAPSAHVASDPPLWTRVSRPEAPRSEKTIRAALSFLPCYRYYTGEEYYALRDLQGLGRRTLWQQRARQEEKLYAAQWTAVGVGRASVAPTTRYRMLPARVAKEVLAGDAWSLLPVNQGLEETTSRLPANQGLEAKETHPTTPPRPTLPAVRDRAEEDQDWVWRMEIQHNPASTVKALRHLAPQRFAGCASPTPYLNPASPDLQVPATLSLQQVVNWAQRWIWPTEWQQAFKKTVETDP